MLQTFFNLDIITKAWPIILAGLGNTVLLSLVVVPLGTLIPVAATPLISKSPALTPLTGSLK